MINGIYNTRLFLCTQPTDMRKGFNALTGTVRDTLKLDPLTGSLFIFKNKSGDKIKILYFDTDGFAIWYKQLANGSFKFPETNNNNFTGLEIDISTLRNILDGIDLTSVRKRKRFSCKKINDTVYDTVI